ncbi:MAG: PqiC family protein [bacterium]
MSTRVITLVCLVLVAASFLQAACSSVMRAKPDSTQYYLLDPMSEASAKDAEALGPSCREVSLLLGAVRFPAYLDRDQMVTRVSPNRVELAAFDRWAEPLEENFRRILADNLAMLLETKRIARYPTSLSGIDYEIQIDVLQFESTVDRAANLCARWFLRDGRTRDVLLSRSAALQRQAHGQDAASAAAALSEALGELSTKIAESICQASSQRAAAMSVR